MKVYIVNREDSGEYGSTTLIKVFSTREKAQAYVDKLGEKYKDNLSFQYKHLYFEIEEVEVDISFNTKYNLKNER